MRCDDCFDQPAPCGFCVWEKEKLDEARRKAITETSVMDDEDGSI